MGGDDNERACRSAPPSPATTTCCSISTAACGSATTRSTARPRPSPRCARPARASRSSPTTSATRPDEFVRKLWRLGFQASVDEVVTCGAALQFVLAERRDGGAAFVIGSQALVDHVADAGLRIVNNTEFATRADVVVVGGARGLRLPRAADRDAGRAARRRADRHHARPHVPDARRAVARLRRRARRGRGGDRPARGAHRRQARAATCTTTARDRLGAGPLPRGRRPARHRRRGRAPRRDRQRARADRRDRAAPRRRPPTRGRRTSPTRSPRSCCAERLRRPAWPAPALPHRQPQRRPRPRRAPAARRRGGAAGARAGRSGSSARTRSPTRASWRAARSAAGEVAAAMGGDGLLGAVAGELRGTDGVLGVLPGGRGNDFARKLGIGADPEARVRRARRRAASARSTSPTPAARPTSGSRRPASTPTCRTSRTPRASRSARRSTSTRRCARCAAGATRTGRSSSTARRTSFTGYSVAVANSGVFGGGMYLVPDASLDDGLLDVVLTRACPKRRYLAEPAEGVQGHARRRARTSRSCAGSEIAFDADRPFAAYADGDPIADLPVTIRVVPRALKVLVP